MSPISPPESVAASERARLLIVTDIRESATRLATAARRAGYAVAVTFRQREAARRLRTFAPDVVALYFRFPMADGVRMLESMRDAESTARVVMIDDHERRGLATAYDLGRLIGLRMARILCRYLPAERLDRLLGELAPERARAKSG